MKFHEDINDKISSQKLLLTKFTKAEIKKMCVKESENRMWTWRSSWSCDLDHLNKLSFPHAIRNLTLIGLVVSEEMLEGRRQRPTNTISSPVSLRLR